MSRHAAEASDPHAIPPTVHSVSDRHDGGELDPDEPRSPAWLPLLGGALFLMGGLALAVMQPAGRTAEELAAEAVEEAKALAPPPPPAPVEPAPAAAAPQPGAAPRLGG